MAWKTRRTSDQLIAIPPAAAAQDFHRRRQLARVALRVFRRVKQQPEHRGRQRRAADGARLGDLA